MSEKIVTAQDLLDAIQKYQEQLFDNDKVSATKFSHYQIALYGCKCIVRSLYGLPQQSEDAWVK